MISMFVGFLILEVVGGMRERSPGSQFKLFSLLSSLQPTQSRYWFYQLFFRNLIKTLNCLLFAKCLIWINWFFLFPDCTKGIPNLFDLSLLALLMSFGWKFFDIILWIRSEIHQRKFSINRSLRLLKQIFLLTSPSPWKIMGKRHSEASWK